MKTYLEFKDEKSHKFWQIETQENTFTVTYGKVGAKGQSKTKEFESDEKTKSEAEKITKQKLKKGYKEVENATKEQLVEASKPIKENNEIDYFTELVKFDKKVGGETYAQSFWIVDDEDDFFEDWADLEEEKEKEFSKSMKIFASADGTGARYAFWLKDKKTTFNNAPIICYGSEGDVSIVSENIKGLIKMLSFGAEAMDGNFYHYIDNDDDDDDYNFYEEFVEYKSNHIAFRKWMKETLNIEPVNLDALINDGESESEEIEKLQKKAKKKLQKSFDKWQYQFFPNPDDEKKEFEDKQQSKYENVKKEILAIVEKKPTADLYFKLAENEHNTKEFNRSKMLFYYEEALKVDKNHIDTLEKIAFAIGFEKPEKSLEYYNRLTKVAKDPQEYYSKIAGSYKRLKDYDKAIEFYTKDIVTKPNQYGDYSQKYIVEICKTQKKDAITILEEIVNQVNDKHSYKMLYKLYFKKKNFTKATSKEANKILKKLKNTKK